MINQARQYYNTLLGRMLRKEPLGIYEIHAVGGRWGGKTWDTIEWYVDCMVAGVSITVYSLRSMMNQAGDLFEQIQEIITAKGLDSVIDCHITKRRFSYGKGRIDVRGLSTTKKGSIAKTGLSSTNAEYIVVHFEEAFEYTKDQVSAADEAIRPGGGNFKSLIKVFTSNPWALSNHYIKRMNKIMRFNKRKLETQGEQFYHDKEGKKIYHWTNWRVASQFITPERKDSIQQAWKYNPQRARVTDLGMPGVEKGLIYAHALNDMIQPVLTPNRDRYTLVAGIDVGYGSYKGAGKTVVLFGLKDDTGVEIIREWWHSNEDEETSVNGVVKRTGNIDSSEMVDKILHFLKGTLEEIRPRGILEVQVDSASWELVGFLNTKAKEMGMTRVTFARSIKYKIKRRITVVRTMLSKGYMRIGGKCELLLDELGMCQWWYSETSNKRQTEPERQLGDDHAITAMEYLIAPFMGDYIDNNGKVFEAQGLDKW